MKNAVFDKTMENVRNHCNMELVTTDKKDYLASESNYHATKWFAKNLLAIEIKKTKVEMEKPI